jgi:hypothetical protein
MMATGANEPMGLMAKKMTLMSTLKCKTTDSKVVHYSVYYRGGGIEIVGPDLERHRCHPSVKNAKDARIEIAKVYARIGGHGVISSWDRLLD